MNNLENRSCPECGQTDRFHVAATSTFLITDDGTADHFGVEYDDDSAVSCPDCSWKGKWKDTDLKKFLVFCRHVNRMGTMHLSTQAAHTPARAAWLGKTACTEDWGCDWGCTWESLRCIGVIREEDCRVMEWEDAEDTEVTIDGDLP